jgi:hypothetical protein
MARLPIKHRLHSFQFIASVLPPLCWLSIRERSIKSSAEDICGAIAETQSDAGAATVQMSPPQHRAASSPIQIQTMQVNGNRKSMPCKALQQMQEQ